MSTKKLKMRVILLVKTGKYKDIKICFFLYIKKIERFSTKWESSQGRAFRCFTLLLFAKQQDAKPDYGYVGIAGFRTVMKPVLHRSS